MNLKNILFCFVLFLSNTTYSQNIEWLKHIGGNGSVQTNVIKTDNTDNIYIAGNKFNYINFIPANDSLLSSIYSINFLLKLDSAGNLLWYKETNIEIFSIMIDNKSNVLFSGKRSSFEVNDAVVGKFDQNGNLLWETTLIGTLGISPPNLDIYSINDKLGNIYSFGTYDGSVYLHNNVISQANYMDIFINKTDSNGNVVWNKIIKGNSENLITSSITIDKLNNIYIMGSFKDTFNIELDTTISYSLVADSVYSIYMMKFNQDGNFSWAKNMNVDSLGLDYSYGFIKCDHNNNIIFLAKNTVANSVVNITYSKLDTDANIIWHKSIASHKHIFIYDLEIDNDNNYYLLGAYKGNDIVDFDSGSGLTYLSPTNYNYNLFIEKVDIYGNFKWVKGIDLNLIIFDFIFNQKITIDNKLNIYSVGSFKDSIYLDSFLLTAQNFNDMYIQKLNKNDDSIVSLISINKNNDFISFFPNPANEYIVILHKTVKKKNLNTSTNTDTFSRTIKVEIKNINGKTMTIHKLNLKNYQQKIDISNLPNGIYFIVFTVNNKQISVKKLLISK